MRAALRVLMPVEPQESMPVESRGLTLGES
jgi:hypothetical protein